jgi:hypothetical protein
MSPRSSAQRTCWPVLLMPCAGWGRDEEARRRIDEAFQLLRDAHQYPADTVEPMKGAALVLERDVFAQGTGIVVPQGTIAPDGSDLNHSYGFGAQAYTVGSWPIGNVGWEYDMVGQGTFASLVFTSGTGGPPTPADISDPFAYFVTGTPNEYKAVPIAGTAVAPDAAGRYAFPGGTPFAVGPVRGAGSPTVDFTVVMYEAGPGLVFSLEEDTSSEWLGTFQKFSGGSPKAMHWKRGSLVKGQAKPGTDQTYSK